jgi:NAD+ diphosphatase
VTAAPDDLCVAVVGKDLLLTAELALPRMGDLPAPDDVCPLGAHAGGPLWGVATSVVPTHLRRLDWSAAALGVAPDLAHLLARGLHVMSWRAEHQFCGRCRSPLEDQTWHLGRHCPTCQTNAFISPAPVVLVAVLRDGPSGREILLARHTYRDTVNWLLVGGWVDPGETLEQAAQREAHEEVGLAVTDLAYWGSEAWGLAGPGILVTLFTARLADPAAEPVPDRHELSEARFFPLTALPDQRAPLHHISGQFLDQLAASVH